MLLHVIWGLVEETAHERPTFSVRGVMLQWADHTPAQVRQERFEWCEEAWEAPVEVLSTGPAGYCARGVLRLHPDVIRAWTLRSLNPRSEAARQLQLIVRERGWTGQLGVITLTE